LARHDLLQERMRDTLRQIIPYERPKLAAIEVSGDQINPARVKPDLTKLTDEELAQLEKIVLKVGTGTSGGLMEFLIRPWVREANQKNRVSRSCLCQKNRVSRSCLCVMRYGASSGFWRVPSSSHPLRRRA
jgi:hypothetical protein